MVSDASDWIPSARIANDRQVCNTSGHTANSGKCKAFRKALTKARKTQSLTYKDEVSEETPRQKQVHTPSTSDTSNGSTLGQEPDKSSTGKEQSAEDSTPKSPAADLVILEATMPRSVTNASPLKPQPSKHGAAYDLLLQYAPSENINLIVGQEPNVTAKKNNICYKNGDIFLRANLDNKCSVLDYIPGPGYVCIEFTNMLMFSCYFSPNKPSELIKELLTEIETIVRTKNKEAIIAGDFNAKSLIFGSRVENEKGRIMEEWLASNDLVVINRGHTPHL
ncbi:uncharacterized protein LOC115883464 [Sitophilus oryzae]|uniref:Uncharacterized protein LOC115883464 n=1 Tax=Sitophilus oryzae TaxID=7048 RepID=A0A6J2Y1U8_SITOR|nr:uncharacterized protein LOC115883464 [Sitophilus oryzae]